MQFCVTSGTFPFARGGTGATSFDADRIPHSDGSVFISTNKFTFNGNTLYAASSVVATPSLIVANTSTGPTYTGLKLECDSATNPDARNWFIGANVTAYGDFQIITSNTLAGDPVAAGTTYLAIDKDGNVGIGTSTPAVQLHQFSSTDYQTHRFQFDATGTDRIGTIDFRATGNTSAEIYSYRDGANDAQGIRIGTRETGGSLTDRVTVNSGGDVGIGTDDPTALLDIYASTGVVQMHLDSEDSDAQFKFMLAGVQQWILGNDQSESNNFYIRGDGGSVDEFVTITQSGFVGIGDTSPSEALVVKSSSNEVLTVETTTTRGILHIIVPEASGNIGQLMFGSDTALSSANQYGGITARVTQANPSTLQTDLTFETNSGDSVTEKFRIKSDGKVGVGTTSPQDLFEVRKDQGGSATKIIVSNGGTVGAGTTARVSFYEGTTERNYFERRRDGTGEFALVSITDDSPVVFENATGEYFRCNNSKVGVGISSTSPDEKFHVQVESTEEMECMKLEQNDVSEGFIYFQATSGANTTNPITSYTSGNSIQGFVRVEINGTDRWMPFYNDPTS